MSCSDGYFKPTFYVETREFNIQIPVAFVNIQKAFDGWTVEHVHLKRRKFDLTNSLLTVIRCYNC